jgi:rhodanese-related sulfurtransferase
MKHTTLFLAGGAFALLINGLPAHAADVADCPDPLASRNVARCDGVRQIAPVLAHTLKQGHAGEIVMIDVRRPEEIETGGLPAGVDLIAPWSFEATAGFVAAVRGRVSAHGGGADTPLLLVCESGVRAREAAYALQGAGFRRLWVVSGGFEGKAGPHGAREGGWKAAGLPWEPLPEVTALLAAAGGAPK